MSKRLMIFGLLFAIALGAFVVADRLAYQWAQDQRAEQIDDAARR